MLRAKKYLLKLQRQWLIINQERQELKSLYSISGVDYTKDKVKSTPRPDDSIVNKTARIIELEAVLQRDIEAYWQSRKKRVKQIQMLEDSRYVLILYKRYIEDKSFDLIAQEMHYSYKYIVELHGNALVAFERILDAE